MKTVHYFVLACEVIDGKKEWTIDDDMAVARFPEGLVWDDDAATWISGSRLIGEMKELDAELNNIMSGIVDRLDQ